jgi:uncharacterized phage protein (TIGR02218 family)
MPVSDAMKDHLAGNVTFLCEIWKMQARDGAIVAFAACARDILFNSQLYAAGPFEPSTSTRRLSLQADSSQLTGAFNDVITEMDMRAGRWKNARITKEIVNYMDLTMGSVARQTGRAGDIAIQGQAFTVEFWSLTKLLDQQIGDLTSPVDRNRTIDQLGIDVAAFTFSATVTAITDRRTFTVDYNQPAANYFKYGLVDWTAGLNIHSPKQEVKSSTTIGSSTLIVLQLAMPYNVQVGDTLNLTAGYDGTREQARDRFGALAVLNGQFEPDIPGLASLITYPEG